MEKPNPLRPRLGAGLSLRLLALVVASFMLTEVLILVPSVAEFRRDHLRMMLGEAHVAALALEATPNNMVSRQLGNKLLARVGARGIVLHQPGDTTLMLDGPTMPTIAAVYDLRHVSFARMIINAAKTLLQRGNPVIRVLDLSPKDKKVVVEALLDEAPIRHAMIVYGVRVLEISIFTVLTVSLLLYAALRWLVVLRLQRLTQSMMAFRDNPEDAGAIIVPSAAGDEIGLAQRELATMQETVRGALQHKERLAALGTAITKINHDLKNMLAVMRLLSDRLAASEVPEVKRVMPNLIRTIDRAVALCVGTLRYTREGAPPLHFEAFALTALVAEIAPAVETGEQPGDVPRFIGDIPRGLKVRGDRDQLFRVLLNLARNAVESGATRVVFSAHRDDDTAVIEIADNGPGLPPKARENLFRPFAGSARAGGMGLGLAIAREIMRAHGGDIALVNSDAEGTLFRLTLPA
ncbi:MAG: sensor histidine kinase [Stellaceae bacterium]